MGIGIPTGVAQLFVDAGDKRQHKGGGGHLIHKAPQEHAEHTQGNGKDPGAFADQLDAHKFGYQPVGKTGLVEGMGHDKAHQHKIDDPVADGARDGFIDGAYAALSQQHDGQHSRPHRIHNGQHQDNADEDTDDPHTDGGQGRHRRSHPEGGDDRQADQNFDQQGGRHIEFLLFHSSLPLRQIGLTGRASEFRGPRRGWRPPCPARG